MNGLYMAIAVIAVLGLLLLAAAIRVFEQYERGVQFRLGKLRDREDQPAHSRDPRRPDRGVRCRGDAGRAQGHPASGEHEALAKQAEAEREKRAKIIAAEAEALAAGELANASDAMMAHPLALQLRNLQTLIEISVGKNSTVVFAAPLMSTIQELGSLLARERESAVSVNGVAPIASG